MLGLNGEQLAATAEAAASAGRISVSAARDIENGYLGIARSGNPIFPGWYADPEAAIFGSQYWIYPTYSAPYEQQVFLDAFCGAMKFAESLAGDGGP